MSSKTTLPITVQKLSPALRDKFKTLCDHHERQEWKKSLKTANEILSESPNQPDTLSMKGLVLLSAPEKEGGDKKEGFNLLKQGLMESKFSSYICWHAYGLYHRGEKQYDDAIKCYNHSLKLYPDNLTILRDLAYLQTQTKDFKNLFETRKKILKLRSDIDFYWFSTAVAAYLNKEYEVALRLSETGLKHYRTTFKGLLNRYDEKESLNRKDKTARSNAWLQNKADMNGLHMFRITVLSELEKYDEAISEIDSAGAEITDKLGAREAKAALLLKAGKKAEAAEMYDQLLKINPDNAEYHRGKMGALGIDPATSSPEKVFEYVDKAVESEPRSMFCKVFRLGEYSARASEAQFREELSKFISEETKRGLPSLFQVLKRPIFRGENGDRNLKIASEISNDVIIKIKSEISKYAPTDLLWSLHFAAQVASARGEHEEAKALIEEAIRHTPTLLDLYTAKARILRHAGDAAGAAEAYEVARKMDLADRYLANRAAKYHMLAGDTKEARNVTSLFMKEEDGTTDVVLGNLQCMWYEYGMGVAYLGKKEYGMALKKFNAVITNYIEYKEAQFDFHYYAFKKCTLNEYLRMLKFAGNIPQFDRFVNSVVKSLNTSMLIADLDKDTKDAMVKEHSENHEPHTVSKRKKTALPADTDPAGDKLLTAEDPLGDALKIYKSVIDTFRDIDNVEIHVAAAKVAVKKGDSAMAATIIERIKKLDPENKDLAELTKK